MIVSRFAIVLAASIKTLHATAPADDYNYAGATHNLQCIALNKSNVQLNDGAGNSLGIVLNNKANGSCSGTLLRFQGMEAITAGNGRTYYYNWGVGGSDGQSGHVWISDMTVRPTINSNARGCSGGLCNGRPAPDILLADGVTKKSYLVNPQPIPGALHYVGPTDGIYRSYATYGEPGSPYGTNHTILAWSWVNKGGGGIARAMMSRNEVFYPSDVSTITMTAYDTSGVSNGAVKAMYGSFWNGNTRIYGWTVHSYQYGATYVELVTCPTVPRLNLSLSNGFVFLTWTNSALGWSLLKATNVSAGWTSFPQTPVTGNGTFIVTDRVDSVKSFYQLRKP
jgi:hypothetical protein